MIQQINQSLKNKPTLSLINQQPSQQQSSKRIEKIFKLYFQTTNTTKQHSFIAKINMRFFLLVLVMVGCATARLCAKPSGVQVDLAGYRIPRTNSYKFAFEMRKERVGMSRNGTGVVFVGNLSTLVLKNQQGVEFVYDSVEFGFECPALHKPTQSKAQLIQLQIIHRFRISSPPTNTTLPAPYQLILFSLPFMVSQYVPDNSLSISKLLEAVQNREEIDLREVLKQQVSGETLVYTTRDWRFGEKSVLRMVRKEIRLMGKEEFLKLKILIDDGVQLKTNDVSTRPTIKAPQKIYQIKSYPFEDSIAFRKEDL